MTDINTDEMRALCDLLEDVVDDLPPGINNQRVLAAEYLRATCDTIDTLRGEVEQLQFGRHFREIAPSRERVREAHSWMALTEWPEQNTPAGHRTYHQSEDESCYLCALDALIDKERARAANMRDALQTIADKNCVCPLDVDGNRLGERCDICVARAALNKGAGDER